MVEWPGGAVRDRAPPLHIRARAKLRYTRSLSSADAPM